MLIIRFSSHKCLCSWHDPSLTIYVIENNSYERTLASFCYSVSGNLPQNALHLITLDLFRLHQVGEKLLSGVDGLGRGRSTSSRLQAWLSSLLVFSSWILRMRLLMLLLVSLPMMQPTLRRCSMKSLAHWLGSSLE